MSHQIHVPQPCHEDWDKMTPEANGRHCLQCCQTVVDFTGWEVDAIAAYLKQAGTKVCGRFTASQLHNPPPPPEILAQQVISASVPLYRKLAAVIILFFGLSYAYTADAQKVKPAPPKTEQHILMGDTILPPPAPPVKRAAATPMPKDTPAIDYPVMGKIAPPKDRPKPPVDKKRPAGKNKPQPAPTHTDPTIRGKAMLAPKENKKP